MLQISQDSFTNILDRKLGWVYDVISHLICMFTHFLKLRWLNTVFAHALANTIQCAHKDCRKQTWSQRSFYLLNVRSICTIFLHNWTQSIDGFPLLLLGYVGKGNDVKNPAILSSTSKKCDWMKFGLAEMRLHCISQEPLIRISQNLAWKYFRP